MDADTPPVMESCMLMVPRSTLLLITDLEPPDTNTLYTVNCNRQRSVAYLEKGWLKLVAFVTAP